MHFLIIAIGAGIHYQRLNFSGTLLLAATLPKDGSSGELQCQQYT
jgi:hypothetical protein